MSAKTPTITPGERLPTPDEAHAKQTARDPHNPAVSDDTTPKHVPPATPSAVLLDLKALRLPADYGATFGVRKLLTTVPVGKPKRETFFRTHPSDEMVFPAMLLDQKEARESYLVMPGVAQEISVLVRPVQLHAAIDRQNNVFLIPVPLPGETGLRNPWHESLAQAVERAKSHWLRLIANMLLGGYDIYVAEGALPDPEWPAHDIESLVAVAFRGKVITSLDHPLVQGVLGKI